MIKGVPNRVALLLPNLRFGGAERVAVNLARSFKETSVQVDFLLMRCEGEFLEEAARYGEVIDLRCDRTYKLPIRLLVYLYRQRPDVLLSSFWKPNLCACLARALCPMVTLLLWEHSPPSKVDHISNWLYSLSSTLFYRFARRVVTVSNGVRADVAALTLGLGSRLCVIPNPIFPPVGIFLAKRKPRDCRKIVWVGRLDTPKNPGLALEAFARLTVTESILVFVGDGVLREQLEIRCKELELGNRVCFTGFYPEPYRLMADADLLLISSDREGLPSVAIEALHCGLRVVATDCGKGIRDILINGRLGSITPVGDIEAMTRAIDKELAMKPDGEMQVAGGRRYLPCVVLEQFLQAMRPGVLSEKANEIEQIE